LKCSPQKSSHLTADDLKGVTDPDDGLTTRIQKRTGDTLENIKRRVRESSEA